MRPISITTADADEKPSFSVAGNTYTIITSGAETNGTFATIDMWVPPNGGPGPHAHKDIEETFYVLDGEVEFKSETQTYIGTKGSYINIPLGGAVHCFKNKSDKPARLLCTVRPAGLDDFFKEIGKPIKSDNTPTLPLSDEEKARLQAIAVKYGQELFPPDYLDR